jgi:tRNA modification GTPase
MQETILDTSVDEIITSYRHYESLKNTSIQLSKIEEIINEGKINSYELIAEHFNIILKELETITGKTTPEDIINNIFSKFCVGK